ncbi:kelch-like protein 12 [Biomphalaria glabrata]|uniref:Kelch-like protein 12 n=1 Tax=Biomphalaria glabrata TaxID=6526 RepID=A0A9U8DXR7_BIOGL|nr:kelch-like protein 12 [Biomphalaria glabrata]XP_013065889.2 kelch-like protein 12 [Biomphalaria glabrata]XP_013065890.2 kelch-like protein 12 [Biomphalaria glabrata]XP_013065891.2 kelch-like protein 12 [Biomphalaria glabrata]
MAEEQISVDGDVNDIEDLEPEKEVKAIYDDKRPQKLLQTAWQNLQSGLYTDVIVIVDERKFPAHRLVLSSLSDYFPPLLKIDEKGKGEVIIQNVSSEDFDILLKYAYTGLVDITPDNVQSVLIAADYLSIEFVKRECTTYMKSHIDIDNVCDALIFAKSFVINDLEQKAFKFLLENLDSVSRTVGFAKLDSHYLAKILDDDNLVLFQNQAIMRSKDREKLVLEAVLRYLLIRNEEDPNLIQILISSVRLPEISEEEVKNCLESYKQFRNNSIVKRSLVLRKKALYIISQKEEPEFASLVASASEVPSSWFRKRKLAFYTITPGLRSYASGGEVGRVNDHPDFKLTDANFKIQKIEIWTRLWDTAEIIGGMKIVYQSMDGHCSDIEYFKGVSHHVENTHIVELEPNEFIIKVNIGSGWLIDSLCFHTTLGKVYGPFGGVGGGIHEEIAPRDSPSYLFDMGYQSVITQGSPAIYNLCLRWIAFS